MKKNKYIYVVELDQSVRENRKFAKANPNANPALPCLYVGRTGKSPEQRFEDHKKGHKPSIIVKRYGIKLLPSLYEHLNPMSYEEVQLMEVQHAEALRSQGYAVWQQ